MFTRLLLLMVLCLAWQPVRGQVRLDIKTLPEDKLTLEMVKQGVVAALNDSEWAKTVELREDYSLWLGRPVRQKANDSLLISLEVEIRTPATFKRGKPVSSTTLRFGYPEAFLADSTLWEDSTAQQILRKINRANSAAKIAATGAAYGLGLGLFAKKIGNSAADKLQYRPELDVVIEAVVFGSMVEEWARQALVPHTSSKRGTP